jgi:hypothetical protein
VIIHEIVELSKKKAFFEVGYLLTLFHPMMIVNHPYQKEYLQFLNKVLESGFPAEKLYSLLKIQDPLSGHLGMSIAVYEDAASMQLYLSLLRELAKTLPAQDLLSLLKLQTKEGWHLGMFIVRYQGRPSIQGYLSLLGDLAQDSPSAAEVFYLIQLQSQDGWQLAGMIAEHQKIRKKGPQIAQSMERYFSLLQLLTIKDLPLEYLQALVVGLTAEPAVKFFTGHPDKNLRLQYSLLVGECQHLLNQKIDARLTGSAANFFQRVAAAGGPVLQEGKRQGQDAAPSAAEVAPKPQTLEFPYGVFNGLLPWRSAAEGNAELMKAKRMEEIAPQQKAGGSVRGPGSSPSG